MSEPTMPDPDEPIPYSVQIAALRRERDDLLGALREAQSALGDAHYWFKRLAGGPCADYSMECKMGAAEFRARALIARFEGGRTT